MPATLDLLQEAYRRGILPPDKKSLYEEADRRGLFSADSSQQPETQTTVNPMVDRIIAAEEQRRGQPLSAADRLDMTANLNTQMGRPSTPPAAESNAPKSAIGNFLTSAVSSVADPLANLAIRGIEDTGIISHERAAAARAVQPLPYDTSRTSGTLGSGAGMAAESLTGPLAPFLFAAQGAENATENVEARAQQGQTAGATGQITDVAGQALLQFALGKLAPGQKLSGAVLSKIPNLGSVAKNIAARTLAASGITATEAEVNNLASNALTKLTGVNPDQSITEGSGSALLQGAAFGAVGQGVHEAVGRVTAEKPLTLENVHFEDATETDPETEQRLNAAAPEQPTTPNSDRPIGDIGMEDVGTARRIAEQRAANLGKPMYLFTGDDGKVYVDSRSPSKTAIKINPDGGYEGFKPSETTLPAEGERRGAKVESSYPSELPDSKAVGDWYSKKFGDKEGAPAVEAMATMSEGKYVLADVDPNKVDPSALSASDKDPAKVDSIKNLSPEEKAKLPPAVFVGIGDSLATADGSHRVLAAQAAGDSTIRAYVPESFVGKDGVTVAGEGGPVKSPLLNRVRQRRGAVSLVEFNKFAENSVIPEMKSWKDGIAKTSENVNRFIGTGLGETSDESRIKQNIQSSLGEQDLDRIRTQEQFRPHREIVGKYTDAEKTQWVEAMESGNKSPDPRTQGAFDFLKKMNIKNKADATAVGIDTSKWDSGDDYVARMAVFPDEHPGAGGRSSIAGTEHYLKGRVFDTYGEFKTAVENAGGKMRYDNPLDVVVAKNVEVRKSIEARKLVNDEMARGTIQKLKAGKDKPEGYEYLDDRLARSLTKNQLWIDKTSGKPRMMPAPRLIAPEAVANQLNQFIAPGIGKTLPIWSKIVEMKRNSVGINFALSAFHVPIEAVGNASISVGQALDNALHGEWGLAGKNVMRAFPWNQARFGSAVREQARNASAHPSLEPLVQATAKAGQRFGVRSVLEPGSFETAKKAFADDNPIAGTLHVLKGIGESVTAPIMEKYVPNLKAGAMAMHAETLLARGSTPDSMKSDLSKAGANVDNILGQVVRSNQFQHKVVTDLVDGVFSAPKFMEGSLRYGGALARDTAAAFSQIARGKAPTLTPAMYTLAGYAITHATLGASIQAVYTMTTTGKAIKPDSLKDYFYPRTGRKNPDGSDERVSIPDPMSFFTSAYSEGVPKAFANRVAPLWRSLMDVVNNSDYRNVKVREGGAGQQVKDSLKHVASSQLPFSVNNAIQRPAGKEETTDLKVAGVLGVRKAPSRVSESAATQLTYDLQRSHLPAEARTQEQADKSDLVRSLTQSVQNKEPGALGKLRIAVKEGKIETMDAERVRSEAASPKGLAGLLKNSSSLSPDELMQVWDAATPDERHRVQWVIRSRVERSETINPKVRRQYLQKLISDTRQEATR